MASTAEIYRMVGDDHVCPFGIKAKALLEQQGFEVNDHPLSSKQETDAFKKAHDVSTTPQVFIGEERIGGYNELRVHFGLLDEASDGTSYTPIIAIFAVTALMACAASWSALDPLLSMVTLERFVAFSMCVLAILKLRDLEAFSNTFVQYDLLARRAVRYAYVYPFGEAFVGIGMIAGLVTPLVAAVALFIGSIGTVSVVKAVYIEKRDLNCACVGGDSEVPLGFVSLTENLMMVFMGLWMLFF